MAGDHPGYAVSAGDAARAAAVLRGVVTRTPLLENAEANEALGCRLLLKAECAQRTGAFKIRGAYYRITHMNEVERARGVITYSSGNHALGVSLAARLLGTTALIVMPSDVPPAKMAAVKMLGAQIQTFERDDVDSDALVEQLRQQTGRIVVPPSADPHVLAGSGTVALELEEQAREVGASLDAVLVPCGGGGLTASTAVVMHERSPKTLVFAAEPAEFDDTRRSLAAGAPVRNPPGRKTICDSIMTPIPNDVTFPINRDLLAGGLVATDDEVREAMRFVYEHYKIVAEPGAVVGVAAVLNGQADSAGKTVATVVTGGNVDAGRFCTFLEDQSQAQRTGN